MSGYSSSIPFKKGIVVADELADMWGRLPDDCHAAIHALFPDKKNPAFFALYDVVAALPNADKRLIQIRHLMSRPMRENRVMTNLERREQTLRFYEQNEMWLSFEQRSLLAGLLMPVYVSAKATLPPAQVVRDSLSGMLTKENDHRFVQFFWDMLQSILVAKGVISSKLSRSLA